MKNAVTRACAWVSFVLLTCAPLASAQNLEIFAGGARFVDVPGNQVPLQPQAIAVAPNGALYVSDINGLLIRVNVAQGTATALPATSGGLNFNLGSPNAIAFDSSGTLYASSLGGLYKINGEVYCTSNLCTHSEAYLSDGYLEGYEIECPLHGARFDVRDGRVLCQPASKDIATFPVRIEDGEVFIEME